MLELTVWKNQQLDTLRRDLDRLFDRLWTDLGISLLPEELLRWPAVHLAEDATTLTIQVDIPEAALGTLRLTVLKDLLVIEGEKQSRPIRREGEQHRAERRFGSFTRRIQLPCRVIEDEVKATFTDGILRIVMPKKLPARPSSIRINVA